MGEHTVFRADQLRLSKVGLTTLLTTAPMARTVPTSTVTRRRVEPGGGDADMHLVDRVAALLARRQGENRSAGIHLVQGEVDGVVDG
ncbi:hypothetical protein ACFV2U_36095 [Streptomyces sp. NPDC059697]|uniref:hypothetical protein n=1 Tax=Streptomyces sp. NPDC059697 TaxID=3346912 RepID=UPI00368E574D